MKLLPLFAVFSAILGTSLGEFHNDATVTRMRREAFSFAEPEPKPFVKSLFSDVCIGNIGEGTAEEFCKTVTGAAVEYATIKCTRAVEIMCKVAFNYKLKCMDKLNDWICKHFISADTRLKTEGQFQKESFALEVYDNCVKRAKDLKKKEADETNHSFCTRASEKVEDICYTSVTPLCDKITPKDSDVAWYIKYVFKGVKKVCQLTAKHLICN